MLNFSDNGICYKIDGKLRHQANINALVAGDHAPNPTADDVIGLQVSGVCDDIFIDVTQAELRGKRCIMVDHTATTETPVNYDFQVVEFLVILTSNLWSIILVLEGLPFQTNVVIKTLGPAPNETTYRHQWVLSVNQASCY